MTDDISKGPTHGSETGWYQDAHDRNLRRWWNGTTWMQATLDEQGSMVGDRFLPFEPSSLASTLPVPLMTASFLPAPSPQQRPAAADITQDDKNDRTSALGHAALTGLTVPIRFAKKCRFLVLLAIVLSTLGHVVILIGAEDSGSATTSLVKVAIVACVVAFSIFTLHESRRQAKATGRTTTKTPGTIPAQDTTTDWTLRVAQGAGVVLAGVVSGAAGAFITGIAAALMLAALFIAFVLFVVYMAFAMLFSSDTDTSTGPLVRGMNSHYKADGSAKIEYSKSAAADAARDFGKSKGEAFNAYQCEQGKHWHIGHAK